MHGKPMYQYLEILIFFPLTDIMDLRHQSGAMCIVMLGEKTHTRGLQRK